MQKTKSDNKIKEKVALLKSQTKAQKYQNESKKLNNGNKHGYFESLIIIPPDLYYDEHKINDKN